jgi:iron complex transport system ATP-binding protein
MYGESMQINLLQKKTALNIGEKEAVELELKDLSFAYKEMNVLKDINLILNEPKLISIIGPNGVGKSTLIHCINKILSPTGGCVLVNGIDNRELSYKNLAKIMGYVPYTTVNTFPISVTDAVLMGRHPHSGRNITDQDLRIVFETLEMLEIDDLAERSLNELSAGQLQKVVLAKGIAQQPRVLLLDEPTSNLDIKHQVNVTKLLKTVSEEKKMMVIMICHDLNIAAKYSDSIIMMHDGEIFAVGSPSEVITPENITSVYGISCKIIDDFGRPHIILGDD